MLPQHLVNGVPAPKKEGILYMVPNKFPDVAVAEPIETCTPAEKNGPDLAGVDHREEMEQQRREGGGGRAATSIAPKKSEQAWSQKCVFSDILFKSALAFNADRRDQWRALAAFHE
eukprot:836692-Pleurochrysis_carterae.AAC.1